MKIITFLSLFLVGCSELFACRGNAVYTATPPNPATCQLSSLFTTLDKGIAFQVSNFSADAIQYKASCFHTLKGTIDDSFPPDVEAFVIGYCSSPVHVAIRKSYWMKASATERMTLIYHELGHCALGLDHVDGPPDIMNSYLLDERIADREWDTLVKTLFERAKQ